MPGVVVDELIVVVGETVDVPDHTLREVVFRTGSYLQRSAVQYSDFTAPSGRECLEGDPRVGGYSALRRSGAMALLEPHLRPSRSRLI